MVGYNLTSRHRQSLVGRQGRHLRPFLRSHHPLTLPFRLLCRLNRYLRPSPTNHLHHRPSRHRPQPLHLHLPLHQGFSQSRSSNSSS